MSNNEKKKYKIGVSTTVDHSIPIEIQLPIIADCGFDFISISADLNHNYIFNSDKFKKIIEQSCEYNLFIESAHVPFYPPYDAAATDRQERYEAVRLIGLYIKQAVLYEIPMVILHPHYYFNDSKEACLERAESSLRQLLEDKPDNLQIALENLPTEQGSWICASLLDLFGPDKYGFCYDSSHENMSGRPFHLLSKYYNRLTTCHLSDNFGQADEHLPPTDGNINWKKLKSYFDKIPKLSNILFEVGTGESLTEPLERFLNRTYDKAQQIFNEE